MAPTLKDNSLYEYPGFPKAANSQIVSPKLEEAIFDLAGQVPEYGVWEDTFEGPDGKVNDLVIEPTRRAIEEILHLFYRDLQTREAYSEKQIRKNIALFCLSVRARLSQLEGNVTWLNLRAEHEAREAMRVDAERQAVLRGDKRLTYLPRVAHKPFIPSTDDAFTSSPANFAKVIQLRMTAPTNRFVIRDEEQAESAALIQDLILDPRMLTDTQMENLGFPLPWNHRRVGPFTKLEHKIGLLPQIKESIRVLRRLGDGKSDSNDRFGKYRLYATPDGEVLGTTNINSEKPTIYKASLVDAIRRTHQIDQSASKETRTLSSLIRHFVTFDEKLGGSWVKVHGEEELVRAKTIVENEVMCLEGAQNADKVAARDLAVAAMDLESTYTRIVKKGSAEEHEVKIKIPRTAKKGQLQSAIERLRHRLSTGGRKIPRYNANDRAILEAERGRNEGVPFTQLLTHLEKRDQGRKPGVDQLPLSTEQKENLILSLASWQTGFDQPGTQEPLLEPYRSLAELVTQSLQDTISLLGTRNISLGQLKDELEGLRHILKLHETWNRWEELYDLHLGNDRMPFFLQFADDLNRFRRSLPGITPEESQDFPGFLFTYYAETVTRLEVLCREGKAAISEQNDGKRAEKIRKALKQTMREANLIQALNDPADFLSRMEAPQGAFPETSAAIDPEAGPEEK